MATTTKSWNTAELKEKGKANLLNSLSNLKQVQEHGPLVMTHGEGVYLWDSDGKQYMDAFAGLWNVNIGHGRIELGQAMLEQVAEVAFVPTFFGLAAPSTIELAARLGSMFPGTVNHVNFTSGGSESIETALKIARYYWYLKGRADKIKILSRNMAYHGIAMGALAATGIPAYHQGFGPSTPGFIHLTAPYAYRNAEGLTEEQFVDKLVCRAGRDDRPRRRRDDRRDDRRAGAGRGRRRAAARFLLATHDRGAEEERHPAHRR